MHPTSSVLIRDFNAKCLKWCFSDKTNGASFKLDNITITSSFNQSIIN